MISKDSLVCIGYIGRPHSFKGEIQLSINNEIVSLNRDDFVFIEIDGHYIPYKLEAIRGKQKEPVIKLQFVETYKRAQEISGNQVFVVGEEQENEEFSVEGFELIDKTLGTIGTIKLVLDLPQQTMMVVNYNNKECYVPLNDVFLDYISEENQEVWVNLPAGLLDL